MAHALHGVPDGLPVHDAPRVKAHIQVEALLNEPFQNLRLHSAHELHGDIPRPLIPGDVQLWVLLLKLHQFGQQGRRVGAGGEDHPVAEHRLQNRFRRPVRRAQTLARPGGAEPQHGADLPRLHSVSGLVFAAGIQADLVDFFLQLLAALGGIAQGCSDLQLTSANFQPGHAAALGIPGNFKYPGGKFAAVLHGEAIAVNGVEKLLHALRFQPGAEKAGKQRTSADQGRDILLTESCVQIFLHGRLVAEGQLFKEVPAPVGEVHTALTQLPAKPLHQALLVRAGQVHFCHEEEAGHMVALQQPPQGLRVGLHAVGPADDQHRVVQNLHCTLRLGGKIRVARGVQQINPAVHQRHDGLFGEDGDPPLPLQPVGVQVAVPVVHPAQLFDLAREVQHGLGQGGLPRVHMGDQAQADLFFPPAFRCAVHSASSFRSSRVIISRPGKIVETAKTKVLTVPTFFRSILF